MAERDGGVLASMNAHLPIHIHNIGSIAHQPTDFDEVAHRMGSRNGMARCQSRKLDTPAREICVVDYEQRVGRLVRKGVESGLDLAAGTAG